MRCMACCSTSTETTSPPTTARGSNRCDRAATWPKGFSAPADVAVERGTIAVALTKALNIKGGWAMHVFGNTPRYATRELQYLELYPVSSPNQTFTGAEFLGIMGKFEDAQNANEPVKPPLEEPALVNPENRRTSAPEVGANDNVLPSPSPP